MTKWNFNQNTKQYITFSQLMTMANQDASFLLKKNRKVLALAAERQKNYPDVVILAPRRLTWGECLSQAMKDIYKEYNVVAELDRDMRIHNCFWGPKDNLKPTVEQMATWDWQGPTRSMGGYYTGD